MVASRRKRKPGGISSKKARDMDCDTEPMEVDDDNDNNTMQPLPSTDENANAWQLILKVDIVVVKLDGNPRTVVRKGKTSGEDNPTVLQPLTEFVEAVSIYQRTRANPSFLTRNLAYMRPVYGARVVGQSKRLLFKVDKMLPKGNDYKVKTKLHNFAKPCCTAPLPPFNKEPEVVKKKPKRRKRNRKKNKRAEAQRLIPTELHFSLMDGRIVEPSEGFQCLFCLVKCKSMDCLRKHLNNNHMLFKYKVKSWDGGAIIHFKLAPKEKEQEKDVDGKQTKTKVHFFRQKMLQIRRPELFEPRFYTVNMELLTPSRMENSRIRANAHEDHVERLLMKIAMDDFTDVNEGEKLIMKYWNSHILRDGCVAGRHIFPIVLAFVDNYGRRIIQHNIYRNFILHLVNLVDKGYLTAEQMHKCVNHIMMLKSFSTMSHEFLETFKKTEPVVNP